MSLRRVSIPGLAWFEITGSELLQGPLDTRVERSGYHRDLVYALSDAQVQRRGKGWSYIVELTPIARAELAEFFDAMLTANRDDGEPAVRAALHKVIRRLQ